MSFTWPWILLSLMALPLCVYAYVRLQQRRSRDAAGLGTLGAVRGGASTLAGRRRHVPPIIFLVGVALLALASARPQLTLPIPRMEGTVVLAFDVSSSMAADDVEPTRMDAAKLAARAIVDGRPAGAKIGVVVYGDSALVVQPLTDDKEALGAAIDRLVPQSGTSMGKGILTALDLVVPEPDVSGGSVESASAGGTGDQPTFAPAVIVLLSDGENTDPPDPLEAAQTAIDRGVRVHVVGIGTAEGAVIEIDGFNLFTQVNEPLLQEVALLTEGVYFRVEDFEDVSPVYEELGTEFVVESREVEVTSMMGGVSALLLLIGGALSLFWFGRVP